MCVCGCVYVFAFNVNIRVYHWAALSCIPLRLQCFFDETFPNRLVHSSMMFPQLTADFSHFVIFYLKIIYAFFIIFIIVRSFLPSLCAYECVYARACVYARVCLSVCVLERICFSMYRRAYIYLCMWSISWLFLLFIIFSSPHTLQLFLFLLYFSLSALRDKEIVKLSFPVSQTELVLCVLCFREYCAFFFNV